MREQPILPMRFVLYQSVLIYQKKFTVNLAEFIDETLSEILTGIRAAQKRQGGEVIGCQVHSGKGYQLHYW